MLTFLKGVKESNALEGDAVMKQIRGMKIDDMFARNAYLREDGRLVHDMYLVEVKKPSESKARWDCYKILRTIPGENAFRPLNQGGCPLVAGRSQVGAQARGLPAALWPAPCKRRRPFSCGRNASSAKSFSHLS